VRQSLSHDPSLPMTRRQLILGASGIVAAGTVGWPDAPARAAPTELRLIATKRTLDINGKSASALGLMTSTSSIARFQYLDRFAVTLDNHLDEPTLIHWHGLAPPSAQDGMPGLSQEPLAPRASHAYDFPLTQAGTFWMHSHHGFQRAKLLAAPLIVHELNDIIVDEQEIVIFLADFSFREPEEIFAGLTGGQGAMPGMGHGSMDHGTMNSSSMDHGSMDHSQMHHGGMAGDMAMGIDINDVDFDAYLANDRTLADPDVVRVEAGGRLRLRIINASAATNFWIDLGALSGKLIAVDGNPVVPIAGNRFPLAMAQRLDLRLSMPKGRGAYPLLALREGAVERTGIVLATKEAKVAKLSPTGGAATAPLGVALEQRLKAEQPLAARKTDRTLDVDLTGDMMSFAWGINGSRYGDDTPLRVRSGERIEIALRNRTTMAHPMHLHGHRFQVVAIGDRRISGALRDTVLVPAMGGVTIAFDADNPGKWAFHCHNEYHMAAGMMTSLHYEA
jgi:FtsP/CotA-like multicopper oxidase with cupredoxin domain